MRAPFQPKLPALMAHVARHRGLELGVSSGACMCEVVSTLSEALSLLTLALQAGINLHEAGLRLLGHTPLALAMAAYSRSHNTEGVMSCCASDWAWTTTHAAGAACMHQMLWHAYAQRGWPLALSTVQAGRPRMMRSCSGL